MDHNPTPKKVQLLPLFNVNLSQPQLNSTSYQPQPQYQPQLKLNSIWLWHKSNPILFIYKDTKSNNFQLPSWETSYFLKSMMCQPRQLLSQHILSINFILIKRKKCSYYSIFVLMVIIISEHTHSSNKSCGRGKIKIDHGEEKGRTYY